MGFNSGFKGLMRRSAAVRMLGLRVRNPAGSMEPLMIVMCCQVDVSASSWSLVQRSPT